MNVEAFVHYKLGHVELDQQHWKWFSILHLILLSVDMKDYNEIENQMNCLRRATKHNFNYEEGIIIRYCFPFMGSHKTDHRVLWQKIIRFVELEPETLLQYTVEIMMLQLRDHIDKYDFQMIPYLKGIT